jgi:hypothetical protein
MAVTFAGKQPGYPDPKVIHEPLPTPPCTGTLVYKGKQPNYPDPVIIGCIKKMKGSDDY